MLQNLFGINWACGRREGGCGSCKDDQCLWGFVPCVIGTGPLLLWSCSPMWNSFQRYHTHTHTYAHTHTPHTHTHTHTHSQALPVQRGSSWLPNHWALHWPLEMRNQYAANQNRAQILEWPQEANTPSLRTHRNLGKGRDVCCAVLRSSRYLGARVL